MTEQTNRLERMITQRLNLLHRNSETIGENKLRKIDIRRIQHKSNVKRALFGLPKIDREINYVNLHRNNKLKTR